MKVCLLTATKDRHKHLERLVRFSLDQTYQNFVHVIFNNSTSTLKLDSTLDPEKFILVNQPYFSKTGKSYTTLGDIYNDAKEHIPLSADVVNIMDDDDVFLPNHVEEGVKGLIRGNLTAYKPQKSWFKQPSRITLVENVMEPSIFTKASHIKEYGFSPETSAQHLQWLNPLVGNGEIYVDPKGPATFICDWSHEIPAYKTSGNPYDPKNFENFSLNTTDRGDGVITPCSASWGKHYCKIKPTK